MTRIEGHCHCGGVLVSLPAEAYGIVVCHCKDCLRLHGNFFAMLVAAAKDVRWSGELAPQWYESSPQARRAHCPRCGSRLAKQPVDGARTMVSVGMFSRPLQRRIVRELWPQSAPDWYDLPRVEP